MFEFKNLDSNNIITRITGLGIKDSFQIKSPTLESLVHLTYFVFASFNKEGSSVAKYTLFLSTCILRARSWKCSSTCTMYSSMGWKAASVPTLSVRLTWTLGGRGRASDSDDNALIHWVLLGYSTLYPYSWWHLVHFKPIFLSFSPLKK